MPLATTELKSLPPMDMLEKSTMAFGFFSPFTLAVTAAMFFSEAAISFSALSLTPKTLPMSRNSR
ncbi:hypothetical protein BJ996_000322 [Streptomyces phaeogriseichromatogenes]|nr:hypothetical protein [Streptomyces murinus]